ncbi:Peroxisomal acyl-coenzyme A oxidase [Trichostrongylus colubriformis]|uniref:Peroxisomal acyl-coenzyme A oxidase n=1 Tax=Trichostrongylus colubriformis TaxID=6319 RepID=A0AAN8J1J8_TRICO
MPLNRLLREGDHEDLADERRAATFDTDEMAAIIWGNKEVVRRRRQITKKVAEHTDLHDPYSQAFMTRTEHMDHAARKATKMLEDLYALDVDPTNMNEMYHLTNEVIGISGYPLALHGIMFIPTLQAQCSDDQMHWLEKAMTKQIIGTYAQTELGHGTQ